MKLKTKTIVGILLIALTLMVAPSRAQEALSPRLQIGISLLPAVVAANKRLGATDSTQSLPVFLVYQDNRHLAEQLKPSIEKLGTIRDHPLEILSISVDELLAREPVPISAIFVTEAMGDRLEDLVQFAGENRVLLFSPFKGDVERGVAAGFQVTDKVLPMVNMTSLKNSNIELKAFFLRIAVKHE